MGSWSKVTDNCYNAIMYPPPFDSLTSGISLQTITFSDPHCQGGVLAQIACIVSFVCPDLRLSKHGYRCPGAYFGNRSSECIMMTQAINQ